MRKIALYLPDDLKTDIEIIAKKGGRSEVDVLRDAIRAYTNKHRENRWPKSIEMVSDGSFDPANDEQYLHANWKLDR